MIYSVILNLDQEIIVYHIYCVSPPLNTSQNSHWPAEGHEATEEQASV